MALKQLSQTIEETKDTGKKEIIKLAKKCLTRYKNVKTDFDNANEEVKTKELIEAVKKQGKILKEWRDQYKLLPHHASICRSKFLKGFELPRQEVEKCQGTQYQVEKDLINILKGIKFELDIMAEILERNTDVPHSDSDSDSDLDSDSSSDSDSDSDDDGTTAKSRLQYYVNSLTRHNQYLAQFTDIISDKAPAKEGVSPRQATEEPATNTENSAIAKLAQSCIRDYFDVCDQFGIVSIDLFLAWMERNEAKSDEKITKLQGLTLDDAKKVCMEKIESPGSVFHQLKVFYNWANRNGVFKNGENSLDHRLGSLLQT